MSLSISSSDLSRRSGAGTAVPLTTLTMIGEKVAWYPLEPLFAESWQDAELILGPRRVRLLAHGTAVTLKPEAVVARRCRDCVAYLRRRGFTPIAARRFRYRPETIDELWRYQWTLGTPERLAVAAELYTATDSLFVLLRDDAPEPDVPASVRLRAIKGHAIAERREDDTLRAALLAPNRMMGLVHTVDEPIDLVRELGVLFERGERRRLYSELRSGCRTGSSVDLSEEIAALERASEPHSLDIAEVLSRMRARVRGCGAGAAARRLLEMLDEAEQGAALPWFDFLEMVEEVSLRPARWDLIVLGTSFTQHDIERERALIDDEAIVPRWFERARTTQAKVEVTG